MSTYNNKYDILGSTIKPNPASVKYWADLASNPNGGDLKYFNGKDWVYVNSKATGDITELQEDVKQLQTDIKNKVDKVSGKGLSTNDYTTAEKNKLAGIAANANNYTLPTASDSTLGGIKTGFVSTDTKKAVKVQDGKAYVEIDSTNIEVNDIPNAESFYSYGVSWQTGSLNATLARIGNLDLHRSLPIQNKMRGCTLADDGTVNHYFKDDWSANEDGTPIKKDGSDGMVMIEIPEFYVKCQSKNGIDSMSISEYALDGYTLVKKQYVSAYEATVDRTKSDTLKLASVVNTTANFRGGNNDASKDEAENTQLGMPLTATTRVNFRKYARNRAAGSKWNMLDFFATNTIWLLYSIEYANWNSQLAFNEKLSNDGFKQGGLGSGVTNVTGSDWSTFNNYYPIIPCGTSDALGNKTGEVEYTLPSTFKPDNVVKVPRYRGIENPFGHIWKNVDGVIFDIKSDSDGGTSTIYLAKTEADYGDTVTEGFSELGQLPRKGGAISDTYLGTFIPSEATGASSTTGRCDNFETNIASSSLRTLLYGGSANSGANAGLGYCYSATTVGNSAAHCGSRLVYRP
nr:MAG TPA: Head fiber protein [Caudoviricetes sp.]